MGSETDGLPVSHKAPRRLALFAVTAVVIAIVSTWLSTRPTDDAPSGPKSPPAGTVEDEATSAPEPSATRAPTDARLAKVHELQALSETYRNTTFVTAIRTAGFVCRGLEDAYGGLNDSMTWSVNCYDMLAYAIGVDDTGALQVAPMLQHFDGVFPVPRQELPLRPPQLLPPPR